MVPPCPQRCHQRCPRSGLGSPAAWRERGRIRALPARRVLTHGTRRAGQPPVPAPHGTGHPPAPAARPGGAVPSRARCPAVPPVPRRGCPVRATEGGTGGQGSPGLCRQVQPPQNTGDTPRTAGPHQLSPPRPQAQAPPCPRAPPALHTGTDTAVGCLQGTTPLPTPPGHPGVPPCAVSALLLLHTPHCPPTFPAHPVTTPNPQCTALL